MPDSKKPFLAISLVLVTLILLNILVLKSSLLGLVLGLAYILYFGSIIGQNLFNDWLKNFQIIYGLLMLLAGASALGAIIYFFYQLNLAVLIILILLPPLTIYALFKDLKIEKYPVQTRHGSVQTRHGASLQIFPIIILLITAFYLLIISQTDTAIRSPWEVINPVIFIIYFLTASLLLGRNYSRKNLLLTSLFFFLTFSIALIVYRLGFSYDAHIHQATENEILKNGFILPKPFYYLGQYSLVIFLAKLFQISVITIDKLLVPVLSALFLPASIYLALIKGLKLEEKKSLLTTLAILILPFSTFIVTTPQSLANLLLLATIFLFIAGIKNYWLLGLLALTTLLIHPLSGIPLLIFLLFTKIFQIKTNRLYYLLLIPASISIPALFYIGSFFSNQYSPEFGLKSLTLAWPGVVEHTFSNILELTYLLGINFIIIFLVFLVIGMIKSQTSRGPTTGTSGRTTIIYWQPLLLTFASVFINFLILKFLVNFPFLIDYEQGYYPKRLLEISLYFLLPVFLLGIYYAWARIEKQKPALKLFALLVFAGLLTISFYLSYPVKDKYRPATGFNLSASDIKAVNLIQNDAREPYLVLANQMTSAAAIKEFGFGHNFYYPIPTSTPLYQYYLKMVYEGPAKKTMAEAMALKRVNLGYFVINDYWWGAEDIIEAAKQEADDWWEIDGGKTWVFKFVQQ